MAVYTREQNKLMMLDGGAVKSDPEDDLESGQDVELSTCSLNASLVDSGSPDEAAISGSPMALGLSGICLPRSLRFQFLKQSMEPTYQAYFNRVRRDTLHILVLFSFLFDIQALILYCEDSPGDRLLSIAIMGIFAIASLVIFCLCKYKLLNEWTMKYIIPFAIWILLCTQTYVDLILYYSPLTPSDGVGWQTFFIFASFAMMPLRLSLIIVLCLCSIFIQLLIVGLKSEANKQHMEHQITANLLLYMCAIIVGIISFLGTDRKQRRAFLEMKASLENKMILQEQSAQQEGLLLSVLPRHVADAMMGDVGKANTGAFNRIYIKRHESVSILFADIVGFTAMSSKMSAPELVKTLNALFANFDKLSDKNHQLRIKILGDCYYCICGVPDQRPDHAACTIQMGLDMVVAIAAVREKTKSGVDMRVGIHTGAVLAGVMGQKRWQFDVWSTDVKLANCMESGGVPGRVHISQATYDCLNGEFQVEPGDGGSRDDYLKSHGVVSYLVIKPKESSKNTTLELALSDPDSPKKQTKDLIIEEISDETEKDKNDTKMVPENEKNDTKTNGQNQNGSSKQANGKTVTFAEDKEDDDDGNEEGVTNKKLYQALVEREADQELGNAFKVVTLRFKDNAIEVAFNREKERQSAAAYGSLIIILLFSFCAQLAVLPRSIPTYLTFIFATSLMSVIVVLSSSTLFPSRFPKGLVKMMNKIETTWYLRNILAGVAVTILGAADLIDVLLCEEQTDYQNHIESFPNISGQEYPNPQPNDPECFYARYFNFIAILVLIGITVLVQITHLIKLLMMMCLTTFWVIINFPTMPELYERYDDYLRSRYEETIEDFNETESKLSATLQLVVITFALLAFNRHLESVNRILYYYKHQAKVQREHVSTLRVRNENLVLNIMPSHVAKHFLNQQLTDEQMYAQDYKECGVMFASIPNFSEFYTEDAINNQGTECLRFLNEIISDFDDLLNLPKFSKTVSKIKTINSTYMAASGMFEDPSKVVYNNDKERWQHFCDLVEFGFALKDTLDKINMQSFNSFVMKIGLNRGPLLAGVIGARKPHYDIWGNTVNVASRMDSTGKAGHIQVVEEVMELLKSLYGFTFEQRGLVKVKGKGQLMTYYLTGRERHDDMDGTPLPGQI